MTTPATNTPAAAAAEPVKPTPGTPEYDAAMIARADAANATGTPAAPAVEKPPKPEGIPDKFWDADKGVVRVEDLAKAHRELEAKVGTPSTKPAVTDTTVTKTEVETAGLDWDGLNTEFAEKGALSPETYAKLAEKGFPKERVDTYIAGQQAAAKAYDASAYEVAGGNEQYGKMVEWAKTALSADEAKAFDASIRSMDEGRMKFAIRGLRASYDAANGTEPTLVTGKTGAGTTETGFKSLQELSEAQKDPRYKKDPAYRAQIENRVKVTTAF